MRSLLILSGGVDSTTLLYDLLHQGYEVEAVTFDYGQKHKKEIEFARKTCKKLNVPNSVLDLKILNEVAPSSLTRDSWEVPEGHYTEDSMKQTVVPNRNMIFLSVAAARAIAGGIPHLFYAAHSGDHAIYPDCRPAFVSAMETALHLCDWTDITLHAPYLNLTKADIVKLGTGLGVDYSLTWTCYRGERLACGLCGSCTERLEAFRIAGVEDPLTYG
ncbi:MAG: 7-cyano-7-deazaguanine synthase QueC [Methanomicrobiales archaeon]|jgi:7-cyano-7-deazaguanine synthase